MLTFATKKLSTGGQKEDAASFLCPGNFDQAVMVAQWYYLQLETRQAVVT